jgi:hypothetical protein
MKIIILGAGWYGLYCANILMENNIDIIILEKSNNIFTGSSSKNQNRLHLGYHYPRSVKTINECIYGYSKMLNYFKNCIDDNNENLYLLHKNSNISKINYENKYDDILKYDIPQELIKDNFLSCYKVNEKIINFNKIIKNFEYLKKYIIFNYNENLLDFENLYYDNIKYDYIIDCTFNMSKICEKYITNFTYELCISLIYEKINDNINFSLTVMDGLFYSLYPYPLKKNLYTLTDVEFTPLIKTQNRKDLFNYKINDNILNELINNIENKILKDYPNFKNDFKFKDYFTSIKNKFDYLNDDRSLYIKDIENKNIIIFIGGKITGIFEMEKYLSNKFNLKEK